MVPLKPGDIVMLEIPDTTQNVKEGDVFVPESAVKRGRLVQLIDNGCYEDIPVGAIGIVMGWHECAGSDPMERGGLYTVLFPVDEPANGKERIMFVDRFKHVGEVQHG